MSAAIDPSGEKRFDPDAVTDLSPEELELLEQLRGKQPPDDEEALPAETPPETPPAETPPAETPPETPPNAPLDFEPETPPAETPPAETPPATPPANALGLDLDAISAEFAANNGALTPATLAAIREGMEKANLDPEMANIYVEGLQARGMKIRSAVFDAAGGEAEYRALQAWAKTNLSPGERMALDNARAQGPEAAALAVQGAYAKYLAAHGGAAPRNFSPETPAAPAGGEDLIRRRSDWVKLQDDPKYHTDEAFRRKTDARLEASMAAGVYDQNS